MNYSGNRKIIGFGVRIIEKTNKKKSCVLIMSIEMTQSRSIQHDLL